MRLPDPLSEAIENKLAALDTKTLKTARGAISDDYRSGRSSRKGFRDPAQMLSYLATRMPATFGACSAVFQEIRTALPNFSCRSFLDLGAGPGTASWAALEAFGGLSAIHLIEREADAIEMGRQLCQHSALQSWFWKEASLDAPFELPAADLAVLSYSYGELESAAAQLVVERLWDQQISLVAVIEPGAPRGFEKIRALREFVLAKGAQIVAPCPHAAACPMSGTDWCHFAARIERTRLHRQLKGGTLGYEDEKFSYLVYAHPKFELKRVSIAGRVIRHPHKGSGFVKLPLCAQNGLLKEETVTRSDKENYRKARDAEWGSAWMYAKKG